MQSKGLSLKMKFLLFTCMLSMVLAAADARHSSSSESSGSDSDESLGEKIHHFWHRVFQHGRVRAPVKVSRLQV